MSSSPMKTIANVRLKAMWKLTTAAAPFGGDAPHSLRDRLGEGQHHETQPMARKARLPTGRRRLAESALGASSNGGIAPPRLAPRNSAMAATGVITLPAASEASSSMTATLECAAQVRSAASARSRSRLAGDKLRE